MSKGVSRITLMIIGVVMVVLGVISLIDPTFKVLFSGIGVLLYGGGSIMHWLERRKMGYAKKTTLVAAIVAIAAGTAILIGENTGVFAMQFMLYILALWLIAAGILEIIGAVIFRKAMTTTDLGVQAPGSIASMVLGSVLIFMGVFAFIQPLIAVVTAGIVISLVLIIAGLRMLISGFYAGVLLKRGKRS